MINNKVIDGSITPTDPISSSTKVAFVDGESCWTHAHLATEIDRLAAGMVKFGVRSGNRVCLHLHNGPLLAVAYFACFRLGAIAVPLNLRFTAVELEDVLGRVQPSLYLGQIELYQRVEGVDASILPDRARFITGDVVHGFARPWAELLGEPSNAPAPGSVNMQAPAILLTTSGTTGKPKFVAHSLEGLAHVAARLEPMGFTSGQAIAFVMPMAHASGLSTLLAALRLGVMVVFVDGADPEAILDVIEHQRSSILVASPATFARLIERQTDQARDVSSLRVCLTSSDVCPTGQQDAFAALFGLPLRSFWASTEGLVALTYGLQTGSVSRLIPNTEIRLVNTDGTIVPVGEVGEMLVRGPTVMLGYWSSNGLLEGKKDGWYSSGDLMRQDKEGNIWFVSRLNDIIVRGGSNISPVEVEQVLSSHPAIRDAAVIGVEDPVLGQRVVGFVRLNDNVDIEEIGGIQKYTAVRLAAYKIPERLLIVSNIPRNGLGKIERKRLASQVPVELAAE
jgi:long-chain acyl-CoA synthetase